MKSAAGIVLFAMVAFAAAHPVSLNHPEAPADQLTIAESNNLLKTVMNAFNAHRISFVNNITSYITRVSEDIKSPEVKRIWGDMKGKLSKVVDDINAQSSNVSKQVAQLGSLPPSQEKFDSPNESIEHLFNKYIDGIQIIGSESNKAVQAISQSSSEAQDEVEKFTDQAELITWEASVNIFGLLAESGILAAGSLSPITSPTSRQN